MAAAAADKSATSTIHTYLMHFKTIAGEKPASSDLAQCEKVVDIKDYPDMGGDPEKIESTTLSDESQTNVNGVQKLDSLTFTSNYVKDDYKKLKDLEKQGEDQWWAVYFGADPAGKPDGHNGILVWKGGPTTYITSGKVNAVREMKTTFSTKTGIEMVEPASA
jgi:hypothetical protein